MFACRSFRLIAALVVAIATKRQPLQAPSGESAEASREADQARGTTPKLQGRPPELAGNETSFPGHATFVPKDSAGPQSSRPFARGTRPRSPNERHGLMGLGTRNPAPDVAPQDRDQGPEETDQGRQVCDLACSRNHGQRLTPPSPRRALPMPPPSDERSPCHLPETRIAHAIAHLVASSPAGPSPPHCRSSSGPGNDRATVAEGAGSCGIGLSFLGSARTGGGLGKGE